MAKQLFHGFEPHEVKSQLESVQLRADPAPPAVHILHDVLALPGQTGLYTTDGKLIEEARPFTLSADAPAGLLKKYHSKARKQVEVPSDVAVFEEPVLFGGYLGIHYGHFLIDSMARLWARDLHPGLPILFTTSGREQDQPQFSTAILSTLHLSSRVFTVERASLFREAICPGTAFEYRWKVFSIADEPHMQAAETIAGSRSWNRPVYLSRRGLPDQAEISAGQLRQIRKTKGEAELEAELSRRGIEVVLPETLPLPEQVALFRSAPLIIGPSSSAFHTSLFTRSPRLRLAILNWGKSNQNDLLVGALKPHKTHYMKTIFPEGDGRLTLDVALSLRLLEDAGLIEPRTVSFSGMSSGS